MTTAVASIGTLTAALAALFAWAFRNLPRERWQVLAAIPRSREPDGSWRAVNLTYYGLFTALGVAVALAVAVFLPGSVGLPLSFLSWCIVAVMALCLPAAKIINRMVEGHWHGFTVGGASFVGMLAGPWLVWAVASLTVPGQENAATLYVLGSAGASYALGEGIGRLACISFGCCYGRPLADCPAPLRRLFGPMPFVFEGRLKKAAYAHHLEGRRLLPVQAMTAVVCSTAGLVGLALFLSGRWVMAYVLPIAVTQLWRFASEFLRADHRGGGRITAYQSMAIVSAVYTFALGWIWPAPPRFLPDAGRGLALLWTPGAILLIQAIAAVVVLRMGLSTVTTARVALGLRGDWTAPAVGAVPSGQKAVAHGPRPA